MPHRSALARTATAAGAALLAGSLLAPVPAPAATGPTAAFVASKRLIARLRGEALWDAVAEEARGQEALRTTADYREGFAAFQAKRRPEFRGE